MARRRRMSKRSSRRLFSKTASRRHKRNRRPAFMRGGYRI